MTPEINDFKAFFALCKKVAKVTKPNPKQVGQWKN